MGKKIDVAVIGSKGGTARAANLSAEELAEASRRASNARWEAYYAAHPEKLRAKLERAKKSARPRGRPRKTKAKRT
jgi:hypothetical protein